MDVESTLLYTAIFSAVALAIFGVVATSLRVRARDLRHLGTAATQNPTLNAMRPILERMAYLAAQLPQHGHRAWAREKLRQANLIQQWSPELIETMKLLCSIAMITLSFLLCQMWGLGTPWLVLLGLACIAYFIPDIMLWSRASGRQEGIRKSLPFVIDLLAVSSEAGLAFQQAIRNVITNSQRGGTVEGGEAELLYEFEGLLASLQMGRTLEDSLTDMSRRIGIDEFTIFANSILQADRLGTPVSDTLRKQSEELRQKNASRVETKANQAPVKILFPLMIFIFPVTGWIIIAPVLIQVFYGKGG